MRRVWIGLVGIGLAAGCERKASEQASAPEEDRWEPDIAAIHAMIDMPKRRAALQGSWVVLDGNEPVAVTIAGSDVRVWNGRSETQLAYVADPCMIGALTNPSAPPSAGVGPHSYRVHEGVAEIGTTVAGTRTAQGAMACYLGDVYFLIDGHCVSMWGPGFWHDKQPTEYKRERCGFRRDGDREVFFIAVPARGQFPAREEILNVDGWRIDEPTNPTLPGWPSPPLTRFADAAAARAFVDADASKNDPLLIAKAAGGVVDDLETIPDLIATYASGDKKQLLTDQRVRVRAIVTDHVAGGRGKDGKPWSRTWTRLVDPAHPELHINCWEHLAPTTGAVTIEGKVCPAGSHAWTYRSWDVPGLCACAVSTI